MAGRRVLAEAFSSAARVAGKQSTRPPLARDFVMAASRRVVHACPKRGGAEQQLLSSVVRSALARMGRSAESVNAGEEARARRIHVEREAAAVEPTYGVGPVGGVDRDPQSKGSTPDDFRADDIHMAEPKEVAKEKAAVAQEEPPDFQVRKVMPQREQPVAEMADPQAGAEDQAFERDARKAQGTAEKQGKTTGEETDDPLQAPYGATPDKGTTRS